MQPDISVLQSDQKRYGVQPGFHPQTSRTPHDAVGLLASLEVQLTLWQLEIFDWNPAQFLALGSVKLSELQARSQYPQELTQSFQMAHRGHILTCFSS